MTNLSSTIKTIQNIMRKDSGVDGDAQRIGQLSWMLFLKIFSDSEENWSFYEEGYESPIPAELQWSAWASDDEGITGDELLDFVNNKLFPTLKNLPTEGNKRAYMIRSIFEDAFNYMKSGQLLRQIINKINEIDFNSSEDRHIFGDIYEQILKGLQSAGNAGEFYTPRAVTQFMTEMTNPQLGQTVLDPACGTGGFLACAVNYMRKQVVNPNDEQKLQKGIIGWEKKQLPHILCTTNMILHGLDVPNIQHLIAGSLAKPLNSYGKNDKVDIILTNPPFGGMEEDGIENNFPADVRTKETADLFLVLIMKLLKDGGKCAMVLPDGALFGEGVKTRIKEKLLTECNLHTIIRLPKSVFAPYTSINTNLLFFEKGSPTTATWFYRLDMPEGVKAFNKTNPMTIEHFAPVKEWWNNRQEIQEDGFDKAKQYTFAELKARNFNLDLCGYPTIEEEILEPKELIDQYQAKRTELNANIDSILADINKILGIA